MKTLDKTIRTALTEGSDWKIVLNDLLISYRSTPHPATGASPASVLYPQRRFKTRLPASNCTPTSEQVNAHFETVQQRAKIYTDQRRNAKEIEMNLGDLVLIKQHRVNKFSTPFKPNPYKIIAIKGSMVTAKRGAHVTTRNATHFKRLELNPSGHVEPKSTGGNKTQSDSQTFKPSPMPPARGAAFFDKGEERDIVGAEEPPIGAEEPPFMYGAEEPPIGAEEPPVDVQVPTAPAWIDKIRPAANPQASQIENKQFSLPREFLNANRPKRHARKTVPFQTGK